MVRLAIQSEVRVHVIAVRSQIRILISSFTMVFVSISTDYTPEIGAVTGMTWFVWN